MEELDIALIKKKTLRGVVALTSRTLLMQIVAIFANFLLTILLTPSTYGIFFVVSAGISFLAYFSDIGLAAALIQKKEKLTDEDLTTTFTIQQLMVGTAVIIALIFSPQIATFYGLNTSGLWLLRALIISFLLSSLKTVPSILLERRLEFSKLVVPQIIETLMFYIIAVILAWRGFGIVSFTWAVMARSIIGLIAMYYISPWKIMLGFSMPVAKKLLRFGVPFQLNSFLALVKDDLLILYLGKALPFGEVGYIGWAKKWAEVPLRLIMDNVIRVTFPAYSRIQHSKVLLGTAIEKTLFGLAATIFPISCGLLFFIQPLITIIPRYSQWQPAVLSFYLFTITSVIASLSTPLTNALNAVGKIKTTLWLMIIWLIATWFLTVPAVYLFGFNGVSIALLIISSTLLLVVYLVKKIIIFSFLGSIVGPVASVIVQGGWYIFALGRVPYQLPWFIGVGLSGVILYICVLWLVEQKRIRNLFLILRQTSHYDNS